MKDFFAILPWLLPPLLGAIIGYVTNAIAIRMLFRPLREWRVFGIRVPLTPGIIPRQRGQLAESIGNMVSRELLTEEAIVTHLSNDTFRNALQDQVSRFTSSIFDTPINELLRNEPGSLKARVTDVLGDSVKQFLFSPAFDSFLARTSDKIADYLIHQQLGTLLPSGRIASFIREVAAPFLSGERFQKSTYQALSAIIVDLRASGKPLLADHSPKIARALVDAFFTLYPELLDTFISWLKTPRVKKELIRRGRSILWTAIGQFNGLQRFFLSAGQYDKTLDERMPVLVDETIAAIRDAGSQDEVVTHLKNLLTELLSELASVSIDGLETRFHVSAEALSSNILDSLFESIRSGALERFVESSLDRIPEQISGETVGDLAGKTGITEDDIRGWINELLVRIRNGIPGAGEELSRFAGLFETIADTGIGTLFGFSPESRTRLDEVLTSFILEMILSRVGDILGAFKVRDLVVNKINSLDILDVERLLLMVIAKHLTWINLFGGILGGMIGGLQVLLTVLLPR